MKILVFMENISPGGLDTFCATLLNAWPNEQDTFVFICNASHPGRERLRAAIRRPCEFVLYDFALSWTLSQKFFGWVPAMLRRTLRPFLRVFLFTSQLNTLRGLFRRLGGDALLVVNGGFPGGECCRIANIAWFEVAAPGARSRNFHNFHNFAISPKPGFGWFENWIDRRLAAATNCFISVSHACAESLRCRVTFRNSEAVGYIYNGIEVDGGGGQRLPDLRQHLGIAEGEPLCLLLASYDARKGHRFLFRSFAKVAARIPHAHLVVCGYGTQVEMEDVERQRQILAPQARIHLLGYIPGGAGLIDQADLVVISSQSFESFGLTAVEAMMRGVPVVATRVGGLPEVVGEGGDGGYAVAPDDVEGFAGRIIALLLDSALRHDLGERGRRRAARYFTAQRMALEYEQVLKGSGRVPVQPSGGRV